ncbi:PQ-loop domain-containing transporter [Patescibacteria group bacterium]
MYEAVGFVGAILAIIAYVPQVSLLLKTRSASGIDIRSWVIWLVATALILTRALTGDDVIFKMLTTSNFIFALVILTLVSMYRTPEVSAPGQRTRMSRWCIRKGPRN